MITVDNALISYLMIPGDYTGQAERVRSLDPEWIAPPLWISEFRSVLGKYLRGGYITLEQALAHVNAAEALMKGRSRPVISAEVMTLAANSGCTAYDCEYVALARANSIPLVTTDKALLRAFPETAVHPNTFSP